jgi:hypothetical protein
MEKVKALTEAPDAGLSTEPLAAEIPMVWGLPGGTPSLQGQITFISTLRQRAIPWVEYPAEVLLKMSTIQGAIRQSVESLTKLINGLGEKASWSPLDKGRTALNQVAECALITGACTGVIGAKAAPVEIDWAAFAKAQAELEANPEVLLTTLATNTDAFFVALDGLSAEDAAIEVTMPWGATYTLAGLANVVYWNNTYHEGQINYIQSLL